MRAGSSTPRESRGTTLADIAHAADVPLGNVYYYFKTKDELVDAVIASRAQDVGPPWQALEQHRTPKARLKAFVRMLMARPSSRPLWLPAG